MENLIFEQIISQIQEHGYAVQDHFLNDEQVKLLRKSLKRRYQENQFKEAAISKDKEVIKKIRGDEIYWIEKQNADSVELEFLDILNNLILYFNTTCYTNIKSLEVHYAVYPIGSYYKRHLDVFKSDNSRKYSMICYLNERWNINDGGQLRLFLKNGEFDILPLPGRLVIFESETIEHEVLITLKKRMSITGWLKDKAIYDYN